MSDIQKPSHSYAYELFIAAPMSALGNDDAYALSRDNILALVETLSASHGIGPVYYAGAAISGAAGFSGEENALRRDLEALRASRFFVLIYPSKIVTSALVEVGYALALQLPCLLLVNDRNDLPYLLNQAEALKPGELLPPLKIELIGDAGSTARQIALFREALKRKGRTNG